MDSPGNDTAPDEKGNHSGEDASKVAAHSAEKEDLDLSERNGGNTDMESRSENKSCEDEDKYSTTADPLDMGVKVQKREDAINTILGGILGDDVDLVVNLIDISRKYGLNSKDNIALNFPWKTKLLADSECADGHKFLELIKRKYKGMYEGKVAKDSCIVMLTSTPESKDFYDGCLALKVGRCQQTGNINRCSVVEIDRKDAPEGKLQIVPEVKVDISMVKKEPTDEVKHKKLQLAGNTDLKLSTEEKTLILQKRQKECIVINEDTVTTETLQDSRLKQSLVGTHTNEDFQRAMLKSMSSLQTMVSSIQDRRKEAMKPINFDSRSTGATGGPSPAVSEMGYRDVEHIAELQSFVSTPTRLRRPNTAFMAELSQAKLDLPPQIKMEVDECPVTSNQQALKDKIIFRNKLHALGQTLKSKCSKKTDISFLEDTLFSMDRTFSRGVPKDIESFFNSLVYMLGHHTKSAQLRHDLCLHIGETGEELFLQYQEVYLCERKDSFFYYLDKASNVGTKPDPFVIYSMCKFLKRSINIVALHSTWKFNEADDDPLILAHLGCLIFLPTEPISVAAPHSSLSLGSPRALELLANVNQAVAYSVDKQEYSPSPSVMDIDEIREVDDDIQDDNEGKFDSDSMALSHSIKAGNVYTCKEHHGLFFANRDDIQRHLEKHTKDFRCEDCDKSYSTKHNLEMHIDSVHKGKTFPCTYETCDAVFKTKSGLYKHCNIHHKDADEDISHGDSKTCEFCHREFKSAQSCSRHQDEVCLSNPEVMKRKFPYRCTVCDDSFPNASQLSKHNAKHGSTGMLNKRGNIYRCLKCNYTSTSRQESSEHSKECH